MPKPITLAIATTSSTASTVLSLFSSMVFSTPSVRAATLTEIAACPAAQRLAALIVDITTEAGTPADAAFWDRPQPAPARQGDAPLR